MFIRPAVYSAYASTTPLKQPLANQNTLKTESHFGVKDEASPSSSSGRRLTKIVVHPKVSDTGAIEVPVEVETLRLQYPDGTHTDLDISSTVATDA